MAANHLNIDKMLTVDNTGMPCPPDIKQLLDKDLALLYLRDKSKDKRNYLKECGVIYYFGDPKSPAHQQGLSDKEILKLCIDNFDLDKDYQPDALVKKLIDKYYVQNITEAGMALDALRKSVHLVTLAANKINQFLNDKLQDAVSKEDIQLYLAMLNNVSSNVKELPNLMKSINVAYENLRAEEEEQLARGGKQILSSMDADEEIL